MTVIRSYFAFANNPSVNIRTASSIIRSTSVDISSASDVIWSASDVFRSRKIEQAA